MAVQLFDASELPQRSAEGPVSEPACGEPRLRVPQRDQMEFRTASFNQLLPRDHEARVVWSAVCQLDLSAWLGEIKAVEGHCGRNSTDPRLLIAVWVYATLQGEGSAREIARLCEQHLVYQWLCGGVTLNHHTLSDFRSQCAEKWDGLLTQIVAGLLFEELVTMQRIAQDGMRVAASAGRSSFRREATLQRCLTEAKEQVETLKRLADENPQELSRRQQAARERAARERQQRIEEAIRHCSELQAQREERAKTACEQPKPARASTTDPEARNMKFPNGGYGPGYNVQFATDTKSGVIVGVEVTNAGSDSEQLSPMLDQLQERYDRTPDEALVDGGFVTKKAITDAAVNHNVTVYGPLKDEEKQLEEGKDPYAKKNGDTPAVADWRARMATATAKLIYRLRSQTAEWANAQCRNHGLRQMPVRGQRKCRIMALLHAITHNLMQGVKLRAEPALETA